jgi:phosphatidylserine decarboxylase
VAGERLAGGRGAPTFRAMKPVRTHRAGGWLPKDPKTVDTWLAKLIADVRRNPRPLLPVVDDLRALIEGDAEIYMLFHAMFEELPRDARHEETPASVPQVRDYKLLLELLSAILTRAPEFSESGMVGLPINALLDWPMGTGAGTAAFLHPKVNQQLRAVLDEWSHFLGSPDSRYVLSKDPQHGWFGRNALAAMPGFEEDFVCDPSAPYHGFASWDAFFTRALRPGARPVAAPDDDAVVVNACESAPYRIAHDVRERDRFWIKAQPYSLIHMLAGDPRTPSFVGGTVYQAFLNALSYHRWHSPVSGKVVKAFLQPGSYYAQAHSEGLDEDGIRDSQGYLNHVATRAIIFLEADDPRIGLMAFLGVGMAEVSTCDIGVYEGQHLQKGDPLGMFHFGGSTYCLLFRPGVKLSFDLHGQEPSVEAKNILVNARLAVVS